MMRGFSGRFRGRVAALAALALLAGCVGAPQRRPVRSAARPPIAAPPSETLAQCHARLDANRVQYLDLPDQDRGGGCTIVDSVKLLDIGVPTANLGAMTCELAATFAAWARYAVLPAGRIYLKSEVVRIETFGTYACRDMRGAGGTIAGRLSEHAHADAVDVSAFLLADGRRITVAGDWTEDDAAGKFLHVVHDSACRRFRTVLSPDYNSAHHDHLHFDMGGKATYCR